MIIHRLCDFIWDERWWFPANYSGVHYGWKDLQNTPGSGIYIPEVVHLHWAFLVGVCFIALRLILLRLVWQPLGVRFGILSNRNTRYSSNGLWYGDYKQQKYGMENTILSKKADWTREEAEEMLREKELHEREPKYYRVCWDLMYYTTMSTYGLAIAYNNNWLQQIENLWIGWPKQHVSDAIYLYYIIKCGFYWNDVIQFTQDFGHWPIARRIQLLLHHAVTLGLIYCSWMMNVVRFGVVIALLQDIPDPLNRTAILCVYAGRKTVATFIFVINLCAWILLRIIGLLVIVFYYYQMIASCGLADELLVTYYISLALLLFLVLCNWLNVVRMYHMLGKI